MQVDLLKRWLTSYQVAYAPMMCLAVATVIHIPLCVIFVDTLGFGVIGLGIAGSVKHAILLVFMLVYTISSPVLRVSLQPMNKQSLKGWLSYLSVSLPTVAIICNNGWSYELYTLLSGVLGVKELATMTICVAMHISFWKLPLGLSEATCSLIGNCIGASNPNLAKRFLGLILSISTLILLTFSAIFILYRFEIVALMSNGDKEI